ncbi:lysylphosphatidylglycerol synthase domain-containing protein [Mesorhizobium sp. WSM4304]|nr:lysylphosphatidylglycerol synthase domain-containing protein [Mesorhizobium sp. WSM4304]
MGAVLTVAAIVYVGRAFWINRSVVLSQPPSFYFEPSFLTALLMYMLSVMSGALAFGMFSKAFGVRLPPSRLLYIFLVSQIGKYIPGNVGQYVGRFYLSGKHGVLHRATASIIIMEIISIVVSSLGIITYSSRTIDFTLLPAWIRNDEAAAIYEYRMPIMVAVLIIFVGAGLAFGGLRGKLAAFFASILSGVPCFIFLALSLSYLLKALGADADFSSLVVWTSISWLLGFVTPGSPAGVGIREYLLIQFLSPVYGAGSATAAALLFRIISCAGDCLLALLGLLFGRYAATRHAEDKS